jgi:hypothetical protein
VVGGLEVGDLENELFRAEIIFCAKSDREGNLIQGVGHLVGDDALEGSSHSVSFLKSKSIFFSVSTKMMWSLLLPSIRVWGSRAPSTMGSTTSG